MMSTFIAVHQKDSLYRPGSIHMFPTLAPGTAGSLPGSPSSCHLFIPGSTVVTCRTLEYKHTGDQEQTGENGCRTKARQLPQERVPHVER